MPSFDLLTQPWLPCLLTNGSAMDLSLLDTLRGAEHIVDLADPSPLVTVALTRLLLAVLHAALRPTRQDWECLWRTQTLPLGAIEAYLRQWQHRFDLFDADRPFYQLRGLPRRLAAPVRRLAAECSSGRRATLFDHHLDDRNGVVSAATAARWLVAHQAFCPSGCLGDEDGLRPAHSGPLAYAAVALPTGDNLLQTLLLNLLPTEALTPWWRPPGADGDVPAWEANNEAPCGPSPSSAWGYLNYLTAQSRNTELLLAPDGSVAQVIVTPGASPDGSWPLRDPWLAYYVGSGVPPRLAAVRVEPESSFWRDLPPLLRATPRRCRPLVIDWLAEQSATEVVDTRHIHGLTVLGLEGSGRRLDRWQRRQCRLPAVLLSEGDCTADFHRALEWAAEYHEALQAARWMLAQGKALGQPGRASGGAALQALAGGARSGYWEALEAPAQRLALRMQGNADEREQALCAWDALCRSQAWVCLEQEIHRSTGPGRLRRWEVTARRHLARCAGRHGTMRETDLDTAV